MTAPTRARLALLAVALTCLTAPTALAAPPTTPAPATVGIAPATARPASSTVLSASVTAQVAPAVPQPVSGTSGPPAPTPGERRVDARLDRLRDRPQRLAALLRRMPKGAELHSHLWGAASTELLMTLAAEDGLCVADTTSTALPPPCGPGTRPATDLRTDPRLRRRVLRAWSMEGFTPGESGESGHDHFFATFDKFAEPAARHPGRLLADVLDTAAAHHQLHQELMHTVAGERTARLAERTGWDPDLARLHAKLTAGGAMAALVRTARTETDRAVTEFRTAAACGTARARPGCAVPFRLVFQVFRGAPPEHVFTQLTLGMELARHDPRFVAVNLVQPEDGPVALRDYRLHMRMLDHLRGRYPEARITLHAGELTPELVPPQHLRFHIAEAVRTGHAERIGHGVDIRHEDGHRQLLRTMAARGIAVETALTSNEQILGVSGDAHPFPLYRAHGVPVVLATDDQGVSRTDITREYTRAARTYGLSYRDLKDLARASLEHAFLPGRSLWRDPRRFCPVPQCAAALGAARPPGRACARHLAAHPKAALQWRQELAFSRFEDTVP
ncbi:adenosine deaminase [Streptomyces coeruleoprunus]|uniref:adenosine deaminase n=1 Tax=Streptomyces coeruleoprunus TaxID=285563 RepID=A0ABV9X744_9ACTN